MLQDPLLPETPSLVGLAILVVQPRWPIARDLRAAFEAKGARVVVARDAASGSTSVHDPDLAAAVLDSRSIELCHELVERNVPFILYTAREHIDDQCVVAPLVKKPADAEAVVVAVESLLRSHVRVIPGPLASA